MMLELNNIVEGKLKVYRIYRKKIQLYSFGQSMELISTPVIFKLFDLDLLT